MTLIRNSNRKGQSAIEYLMTYGWMLLVVAIVGGVIFTTVQDSQESCEQEIMDIESTQQGFGVSDFSATTSSLNVQMENNQQDNINITSVEVAGYESDETNSGYSTLGFGEATEFTFPDITESDNCNSYDISVNFTEDGLESQDSGTLQSQMAES